MERGGVHRRRWLAAGWRTRGFCWCPTTHEGRPGQPNDLAPFRIIRTPIDREARLPDPAVTKKKIKRPCTAGATGPPGEERHATPETQEEGLLQFSVQLKSFGQATAPTTPWRVGRCVDAGREDEIPGGQGPRLGDLRASRAGANLNHGSPWIPRPIRSACAAKLNWVLNLGRKTLDRALRTGEEMLGLGRLRVTVDEASWKRTRGGANAGTTMRGPETGCVRRHAASLESTWDISRSGS